jgi:hypothetical protein
MRILVFAAMILLTASLLVAAQTPIVPIAFEGQWETVSAGTSGRIVVELKLDGNKVTGTVTGPKAANPDQPGVPQKLTGKVDGDILAFNVGSPDGARIITFVGRVSGDTINLNRDVEGGAGNGGGPGAGIFGFNGPSTLTLFRVK